MFYSGWVDDDSVDYTGMLRTIWNETFVINMLSISIQQFNLILGSRTMWYDNGKPKKYCASWSISNI